MKYLKMFENFIFEDVKILSLEELRSKYPAAKITMKPHEKFKDSYFARVDVTKQNGEKEYLGALRGPVSEENALAFFNEILSKNYDKFQ